MQLTGNTILITGGTSGIGRALAEALYQYGNEVVIAGRRQHLLEELVARHPGMQGLQVDMADPRSLRAFADQVRERYPDLNVLVNNVGISRIEDWTADEVDVSISHSIIRTNIVCVLSLTAALLPTLRRQPGAAILTTTSGLAFVPRANFATYCASKAFLHSWLQSLRSQLRGSVEVLELPPPYVQTELGGPRQATDPAAMPLQEYVAEVMCALGERNPPRGEILVDRVKTLRWAEANGLYEKTFAALNGS